MIIPAVILTEVKGVNVNVNAYAGVEDVDVWD